MVFQAYNLFPHLNVLDNVLLAPSRAHGFAARRGRGVRARAAPPLRPRRARARLPGPAVRRPAAAGGDRARARHAAAGAAARRDHQRARPRAGRRGARGGAGAEGGGDDDADRHARDGLRPRWRTRCASADEWPHRRARPRPAAAGAELASSTTSTTGREIVREGIVPWELVLGSPAVPPRRARRAPAGRHLLPRRRLRPRPRRRRHLAGARGQLPHPVRHLLRAREPRSR